MLTTILSFLIITALILVLVYCAGFIWVCVSIPGYWQDLCENYLPTRDNLLDYSRHKETMWVITRGIRLHAIREYNRLGSKRRARNIK